MSPNYSVLDLVRRLSTTSRLAMLTNNGPVLKQAIDDLFPQARQVFGEHVYASFEFGVSKPDPTVYLKVLECLGGSPEEAMFVDDKQVFVDGAVQAGLAAYQFTDAAGLEQELIRRGLI